VITLIPLAGVMNALPGSDGFIHQRAQQGIMILITVVFTPPLMVIGFFGSMLLMIIVGHFINLAFIPFLQSMNSDNAMGVFGLLASIGLYVTVVVTLAHRVYGMITDLKDEILRYMGGGLENLGESSNEQQAKQSMVGGVAKITEGNRISGERGAGRMKKKPNGTDKKGGQDPKGMNKSLRNS